MGLDLASLATLGPDEAWAITGAPIVDGRGGIFRDGTLIVRGPKIESVLAGAPPAGCRVLRAAGCTVMPGLIDCHVHTMCDAEMSVERLLIHEHRSTLAIIAAEMAKKLLAAGFTTVRDTGSVGFIGVGLRTAIQRGLVPGPHMVVAGDVLSMTGGHSDLHLCPHAAFEGEWVVDGVDQVRKRVRTQLKQGVDLIKMCATGGVLSPNTEPGSTQLSLDEMRVAVEEAHNAGKRAAAHAMGARGVKNAIEAGFDTIEHGCLLDEEAIAMLVARGRYLIPTLVAPQRIIAHGAHLPPHAVRKAKAVAERHKESIHRAHRAGAKIAFGTDAGTPFNRHGENAYELELLVGAGLSPMDALVAATSSAAEAIGVAEDRGSLAPGLLADLLIVEGDPLVDVRVLQDQRKLAVVKAGRLVARAGVLVTHS
jgi:imidazolonepropionase-like amidohydrolase